jgi:hypothetical protein
MLIFCGQALDQNRYFRAVCITCSGGRTIVIIIMQAGISISSPKPGRSAGLFLDVRDGYAPCKGDAFQWVQGPPGDRSSRKQSEQSWR